MKIVQGLLSVLGLVGVLAAAVPAQAAVAVPMVQSAVAWAGPGAPAGAAVVRVQYRGRYGRGRFDHRRFHGRGFYDRGYYGRRDGYRGYHRRPGLRIGPVIIR